MSIVHKVLWDGHNKSVFLLRLESFFNVIYALICKDLECAILLININRRRYFIQQNIMSKICPLFLWNDTKQQLFPYLVCIIHILSLKNSSTSFNLRALLCICNLVSVLEWIFWCALLLRCNRIILENCYDSIATS
jgi:hypothetical protein